jgi:hypothetical protein
MSIDLHSVITLPQLKLMHLCTKYIYFTALLGTMVGSQVYFSQDTRTCMYIVYD